MLCRKEIDEICILAEECGFRTNIVSTNYVLFLFEYIQDYDIIITYSVVEGEAKFEVSVQSKEEMSHLELLALCNASGLCLGLIRRMGGKGIPDA